MIEWTPHGDDAALIRVEGRLDAHLAPELRHALDETEAAGRHRLFVVLAGVDFMDSAGLAAVVSGLKRARRNGGELVLVDPSSQVRQLLDTTLLDRVIPIRDHTDLAQSP